MEILLLEQGIHIYYAEDINVYDEKTRETGNFYNQRRRWIASQFYLISRALKKLPKALLKGNIDYCDKMFQWLLPPRLILIGIPLIMSFVNILFPSGSIYKWLFIIIMQFILFMIAIPKRKRVLCFSKALFKIPEMIFFTFINMLRLKGAAKTFIRTEHSQNID